MAVLDGNGVALRPGDHVLIHGVVQWVKEDGDDKLQNVNVQTFEPMYPTTERTNIALNSKQLKSVAPEVAEAVARAGIDHAKNAALQQTKASPAEKEETQPTETDRVGGLPD